MRSHAVDHRTRITRRAVLAGAGAAIVSAFTKVAASFFDWLTRMFTIDGDLRFAG